MFSPPSLCTQAPAAWGSSGPGKGNAGFLPTSVPVWEPGARLPSVHSLPLRIQFVRKHVPGHGLPDLSLLRAGLSRLCPPPGAARTGVPASAHPLGPSMVPVLKWGGRGVPYRRQVIVSRDVAVLGRVVVAGGRAERLGGMGTHGVWVCRQRGGSMRRRRLLPFSLLSPLRPLLPKAELGPGYRAVCGASQRPVGEATVTCPPPRI